MERKYDVSQLSAVGICLVEKCIILHYFFNIVCAHAVCQTSNFSSYIPNPASGNISELNVCPGKLACDPVDSKIEPLTFLLER